MKFQWMHKAGHEKLILFFNGWGCDAEPFKFLNSKTYDVLMFYDYREVLLPEELLNEIKNYKTIELVAWSYGVWVAQYVLQDAEVRLNHCLAINGTAMPVDDEFGISEALVLATLRNLSERNVMKFQRRMFLLKEDWQRFQDFYPKREFVDQKVELERLVEKFKVATLAADFYDTALIGMQDLIFNPENQINYWHEKVKIIKLEIPHFCFFRFVFWDEVVAL